jgi:hypothetical protein
VHTIAAMSRRSTPERIEAARRAATLARLRGEGLTEDVAEQWLTAWDAQAAERGLTSREAAYWEAAWTWTSAERRLRRIP